jgi:hypothetical protein
MPLLLLLPPLLCGKTKVRQADDENDAGATRTSRMSFPPV